MTMTKGRGGVRDEMKSEKVADFVAECVSPFGGAVWLGELVSCSTA